jgi:tRNA dimethylallyltransferase
MMDGKISKDECLAQIQQATRRYAKRQLTWFRNQTEAREVDANATRDKLRVVVKR